MLGEMISHCRIIEELAGGGRRVVYKAHELKLDRTVALRYLPPNLTTDPLLHL